MKPSTVRNYLGKFLVDSGIITNEQLEKALKYQKELRKQGKKGLLGQALVEMGYCTEEDITRALASKIGVPFMSLKQNPIDESALKLITPEVARRYQAIPVGFDNGRLLMAMFHPNDIISIDDLEILTGYDIQPVIIPDLELKEAIDHFASIDSGIVSRNEDNSYSQLMTAVKQFEEEPYLDAEKEQNPIEESEVQDEVNERPAVQLANIIFNQAVKAGASDVHIEPMEKGLRVRFRIDGVLHEVMRPPRQLYGPLISRIKVMANMDIAERRIPQDGRITMWIDGRAIDVRVASMPAAYGEKLTLRLLDRSSRLITLSELGFPDNQLHKYNKIINLPYGFILVTGPTGSGKSTTLYSTLVKLNSVDKHIITLEDPVERKLDGLNQIQVNVKAGMTFASGLRAILRNDPDIIMVGEIRDHETARIAVESALTGHLVFSTLHTNDSSGAITRLSDMGIEPYLTASSLVGVVAQRLVRILCPHCKEVYQLKCSELLNSIPDFPVDKNKEVITLYRPRSCSRCNHTGYKGRVGIYEVLYVTEAIQKLILSRSSSQEIKGKAVEEGMLTLRQDGLLKVKEGLTSLEEVLRVAM